MTAPRDPSRSGADAVAALEAALRPRTSPVQTTAGAGARPVILAAHEVRRTYRLGRVRVPVLRGATLEVREGEWVAALGASGSGKSTLLHLLGGLDRPNAEKDLGDEGAGHIEFRGRSLATYSQRELDRFRRRQVGFVFQFYHLLPELTVLENVLIAAMTAMRPGEYRSARAEVRARAEALLGAFGLAERLQHRPAELSGGERQRVAIARALVNQPAVLLADEPTGNLDRVTGASILGAIERLHREHGQTIVMVTHDPGIAERADRVVEIRDGVVLTPDGRPASAG